MPTDEKTGPLAGLRIVEFATIGPAPFGVMLLADLGAEILRIQRPDSEWPDLPVLNRGRASITLDLKAQADREAAFQIAAAADVLVEGFRPGVMERLGLGPDALSVKNPRLVYGRMTGWGQTGPLAHDAGHDLNFIGLTGMLDMLPFDDRPRAPQNLLGDYAAGGLYLVLGILAALQERQRSGLGQVVDAAIIDGSVSLLAPIIGMVAAGLLPPEPNQGMLAGDAPCYRTYRCADGRFLSVGALEPHFRRRLAERLGLEPDALDTTEDAGELEAIFASRARDEWINFFAGCDCCVAPVLALDEARAHPHLRARSSFLERGGELHPAPAPRFSRTPGALPADGNPGLRLREWQIDIAQAVQ